MEWKIRPSPLHYAILNLLVPDKPVSSGEFRNRLTSRLKIPKSQLKHVQLEIRKAAPECFKNNGSTVYPPSVGLNSMNRELKPSTGDTA